MAAQIIVDDAAVRRENVLELKIHFAQDAADAVMPLKVAAMMP